MSIIQILKGVNPISAQPNGTENYGIQASDFRKRSSQNLDMSTWNDQKYLYTILLNT